MTGHALAAAHFVTICRALAWAVAASWVWKAVTAATGLPQLANLVLPEYNCQPVGEPAVTVIVPARDEGPNVAACVESLLAQDYGRLRILAVDDRSTDDTGRILDELAAQRPERLSVLHVSELPEGWLGKTHAMAMAARHTMAMDRPEYLLFTDADVMFAPETIRRSLARAVAVEADHFVTFPTPILKGMGEGALLGYLGVMGLWATRPWRAENPRAVRDSIGIGAFNLLKAEAYRGLGGFDALRMEILEDLTLARRVKLAGLRQRVAVGPGMVSLHWAEGAGGVVRVMTKNLFAIFRFRPVMALLACVWLAVFCIAPTVFLFFGGTRTAGLVTCAAIVWLYALSNRHSRIPVGYAVFFPFSAGLFVYSILRSALVTLRDGGVTWRGTFYSLAELRRYTAPPV